MISYCSCDIKHIKKKQKTMRTFSLSLKKKAAMIVHCSFVPHKLTQNYGKKSSEILLSSALIIDVCLS